MVRGTFNKVFSFIKRHHYVFQYGLIAFISGLIFYAPTFLHLNGFAEIVPSEHFSPEIKTLIDAMYFSVVSITTLGFGDIQPVSQLMRAVVSIEVLLGIFTIGQALHAITVKAEEKKKLPHRIAAYRDVNLLFCRLVSYWEAIYRQSVPDKLPESTAELLSQENINKMANCLDLDGIPNVTPKRTWWVFLPQQSVQMAALAEKILDRHAHVLEPTGYSCVHKLLSSSMLDDSRIDFINALKQSDLEMGFPRPTNLGSYLSDNEASLGAIVELEEWCLKEYEALQNITDASVGKPYKLSEIKEPITNPASHLSRKKLQSQINKRDEFRRNNGRANSE